MERKIRVLFVIDKLIIGGTEGQLVELMKRLDHEKFELFLCCLSGPQSGIKEHLPECVKAKTILLDVKSTYRLRALVAVYRLVKFIRYEGIDIVQSYFLKAKFIGTLAGKLAGIRTIVCTRDLGHSITLRNLVPSRLANLYADRFLVNSQSVKHYLIAQEQIKPDKIDVIINGVDLDKYGPVMQEERAQHKEKLRINPSDIVIGVISNLRPEKGLGDLIRAASLVCKAHKDVVFLIVGDGSERDNLIRLAAEHGLWNRLIFAGSADDVRPFLLAFDVGVLCSLAEGFSNVVLEYMAVGLPVVATDVGGNREQVRDGETGFLVPPRDSHCLANALATLINDRNMRKTMSDRALQYCRTQYSMVKMVHHYEDYYMQLGVRHESVRP